MVFGIKVNTVTKKYKIENITLNIDSDVIISNREINIYFNNYLSALKTAKFLKKKHNGIYSYTVFKVSKENLKYIKSENIVSSSEEYFAHKAQESEKLLTQIKQLNGKDFIK